jgi:aldehyde:ferredoxin oxidoreductase
MFFEDALGTCRFNTRTDIPLLVDAVNAATGWDLGMEEAMRIGRRTMHLLRAFNIRHGVLPELDRPGPRYGSTPVDGPAEGLSIQPHWQEMVQDYYRRIGWDPRGWPTRETLEAFDLEYVADDLDL